MDSITVGDIVRVTREERGGYRIPLDCRIYSDDGWYMYIAQVVSIPAGKRYFRVRPFLSSPYHRTLAPMSTRKAYKSKVEKINRLAN